MDITTSIIPVVFDLRYKWDIEYVKYLFTKIHEYKVEQKIELPISFEEYDIRRVDLNKVSNLHFNGICVTVSDKIEVILNELTKIAEPTECMCK